MTDQQTTDDPKQLYSIVLQRVEAGEQQAAVCEELGVEPKRFANWKHHQMKSRRAAMHTLVVPDRNESEIAEIKLLAKMLMDKIARL